MAHYEFIDSDNMVVEVIVGKNENEDGIDWEKYYGAFKHMRCLRTSYNTQSGQHISGGTPFRKNYAGIGYTYDEQRDAFIPPRPSKIVELAENFVRVEPYESWLLDEDTCQWVPPIPMPTRGGGDVLEADEYYEWNEASLCWDAIVINIDVTTAIESEIISEVSTVVTSSALSSTET